MAGQQRRPGQWARSRAHADMRSWLRRNWQVPAVLLCIAAADVVFNAVWPTTSFMRGFLDGAVIVFVLALLGLATTVGSGSWSRLWGAAGETFTADELTRRRRKREGWRIFHGLNIGGHDVDHIAVGPGGVVAIETKFVASGTWRVTADGKLAGPFCRPLTQARLSASKVKTFLGSKTGGGLVVDVTPVLIVWGPGSPELRDGHEQLEGVEVFSGRDERAWRAWLDEPRVDAQLRSSVIASLDKYAPLNHAKVEERALAASASSHLR